MSTNTGLPSWSACFEDVLGLALREPARVYVRGPNGAGKTRLVDQLTAVAKGKDPTCRTLKVLLATWRPRRNEKPDGTTIQLGVVRELIERLGGEATSLPVPGVRPAPGQFLAACDQLKAVARRLDAPVLLVLEDIHALVKTEATGVFDALRDLMESAPPRSGLLRVVCTGDIPLASIRRLGASNESDYLPGFCERTLPPLDQAEVRGVVRERLEALQAASSADDAGRAGLVASVADVLRCLFGGHPARTGAGLAELDQADLVRYAAERSEAVVAFRRRARERGLPGIERAWRAAQEAAAADGLTHALGEERQALLGSGTGTIALPAGRDADALEVMRSHGLVVEGPPARVGFYGELARQVAAEAGRPRVEAGPPAGPCDVEAAARALLELFEKARPPRCYVLLRALRVIRARFPRDLNLDHIDLSFTRRGTASGKTRASGILRELRGAAPLVRLQGRGRAQRFVPEPDCARILDELEALLRAEHRDGWLEWWDDKLPEGALE